MKQTAVEWLENNVWELDNENFTVPNRLLEMISYAKEMEKQQIIDAYIDGSNEGLRFTGSKLIKTAEQYYNETFNK